MDSERRTFLRLAGLGAGATLAGCLEVGNGTGTGGRDGGDDAGTPTGTPDEADDGTNDGTKSDPVEDPATAVTDHRTTPLAVGGSSPAWYRDGDVGHAVAIDTEQQAETAIEPYDLPEERQAEVESFLTEVDFDTERVILVESVGPNGCHDELEVGDVGLGDGALRATARVRDRQDEGMACSEALVYPSTLLAVGFDGAPVDEVAIEVIDGWGETATVTASVDDPVAPGDARTQPGYVRPDGDPEPVAALECDEQDDAGEGDEAGEADEGNEANEGDEADEGDEENVHRHDQRFEEAGLRWGDLEADGEAVLSLRVEALAYEYGDTIRITLRNVAEESIETGDSARFNLQVYSEDGWQDVRVTEDDREFAYTDEAVVHDPGEGFEWAVELTEDGVVEAGGHVEARVCPDLQAGRYRFAFFGVAGDGAVAVAFDLTE